MPAPLSHPYYIWSFLVVLGAVFENEDDRMLFDEQKGIVISYQIVVRSYTSDFSNVSSAGLRCINWNMKRSPRTLRLWLENWSKAGFLQTESELQELPEVLELLSAPELRTLAKTFGLGNPSGQKQQLVEACLAQTGQTAFCLYLGQEPARNRDSDLKKSEGLGGPITEIVYRPPGGFFRALLLFSLTDSQRGGSRLWWAGPALDRAAGPPGPRGLPPVHGQSENPVFQDRDDLSRYAGSAHLLSGIAAAMATAAGSWRNLRSALNMPGGIGKS
ncbi:Fanconi-associated nuclease 1 [Myotis brandtii]|uniref:Fanconi-associated nuclease n=1 Tax=Myotis brandtii TaxID=109478 RepID=S7MET0_MYOBR|nr:Fanconi-associated nuclease 1 [Myotis brandtii]